MGTFNYHWGFPVYGFQDLFDAEGIFYSPEHDKHTLSKKKTTKYLNTKSLYVIFNTHKHKHTDIYIVDYSSVIKSSKKRGAFIESSNCSTKLFVINTDISVLVLTKPLHEKQDVTQCQVLIAQLVWIQSFPSPRLVA